jgi:4-hydroxy-4-methyl-2-oxoglutarate aldolase
MSSTDPVPQRVVALPADQFESLSRLDTCTLANAIEATGVRLRNEGYMDSTLRCLFPDLPPLIGYALPLRVRTTGPPIRGLRYVDHIDWADQLLSLPEPRIMVVEDMQSPPGTGSFLGEVHANMYRALGCAGVITSGAVRDLPALHALRFHCFAAHISVSHAYVHVVEVGAPVTVGGLEVHTGDLMHADQHGVLSIPMTVAADLPSISAQQKKEEQRVIEFCRAPGFTVEGLVRLLQRVQDEHPLPG